MTTAVKAAPRKPGRLERAARRKGHAMAKAGLWYAVSLAVAAAAALILHRQWLVILALGAALGVAGVRLHEESRWHRSGGKAAMRRRRKYQGTATRREISAKLSVAVARRRAAVTSPGLHPDEAPVVIATAKGRILAGSREDSYLAVAPPRAGKTALLACWLADAPGPALATSTRTDLYAHTAVLRAAMGDVRVLNPGGDGGIPSTLAWSPLDGCRNPAVAIERAGYLMDAAPKDSGGKDAWWDAKGAEMLRLMLHAAALAGATMHEVAAWVRDPLAPEPAAILAGEFAAPGWDRALDAMTRDESDHLRGISASATAALSWMDDPAMARAACPAGEAFDAASFVAAGTGTVYLIGADRPHGSLAPYFAAFTAHLWEAAKRYASISPGGRLARPLTLCLDEAAITCPVPLHKWTAEAGGHGITVMAAVQSLSQLRSRWGEHDGRVIAANSTVKVFWGGDTDHENLEAVSAVCGMRDTWDWVKNSDGSRTKTPRQEQAVPPERIRMLGAGQVLVLHRNTRPAIARVTPVWDRPGYERAPLGPQAYPAPAGQPAIEAPRREAIPLPASPAQPALDGPAGASPGLFIPGSPEEVPAWPATSA